MLGELTKLGGGFAGGQHKDLRSGLLWHGDGIVGRERMEADKSQLGGGQGRKVSFGLTSQVSSKIQKVRRI